MSTKQIAQQYVALCREGKNAEIIDKLFSEDVVSVEAAAPPGGERTAKGRAALHGKSKWWTDNHTVHKAEINGPFPHDDRFAVRFLYDITHKPSSRRFTMEEVGIFTVQNEQIVREEFYYTTE